MIFLLQKLTVERSSLANKEYFLRMHVSHESYAFEPRLKRDSFLVHTQLPLKTSNYECQRGSRDLPFGYGIDIIDPSGLVRLGWVRLG